MISETSKRRALVIGARGSIGVAVCKVLADRGDEVIGASHSREPEKLLYLPPNEDEIRKSLESAGTFSTVVFCQGINFNDKIGGLSDTSLLDALEANVVYSAKVVNALVSTSRIENGGRIAVVSSVWQELARSNKFSYTVSKAAVGGFVRATAADLADRRILVNAVLPGPIDNEMTRKALTAVQLESLKSATPFELLVEPLDVALLVGFLTSEGNRSVTGQSIPIDYGLTMMRNLGQV